MSIQYKGETRPYEVIETGRVYNFPTNHCVFCKHCNDILYDFTNGPYMFGCGLDNSDVILTDYIFKCDRFEDAGYMFDEEEYLDRMEVMRQSRDKFKRLLKEDSDFRKVFDTLWQRFLNGGPLFTDTSYKSIIDWEGSKED